MLDFVFHNPVRIYFGKGQMTKITDEIENGKNILITYGKGSIKQNGVYEELMSVLLDKAKSLGKKYSIFEFSGIEANPTYETLMGALEIIHSKRIDYLLAVGGGSVIDGTKFLAAAAKYDKGDPWNILLKRGRGIEDALPMGTVLTMPATGSEMNGNSVISRKSTKEKFAFFSPHVFPKFSILDPTTTFSLPEKQIANGIVDAFVHVMEQYLTYPVNSPIQDRMAEGILLTLIEEGSKIFANRGRDKDRNRDRDRDKDNKQTYLKDYNVRANIMWAATMALNNLIGVGVPQDWSTHMIGHELTAEYGLAHAETLAIILPSLMHAMREGKSEKLIQYAKRVWKVEKIVETDKDKNKEDKIIDFAIGKTREFFEMMGVKTNLIDYKINEEAVNIIIGRLEKHDMTKMGEKGDITLEKCREILKNSL
ncbi:MAG: iron-containing alcohol dehydrogenase [Oligoflexia bacterium]|nr:iron-containing alcohol dehydrogenase [Oligoflexia bacterium]